MEFISVEDISAEDIFAEDISVEDISEEDISIQLVDNFIILCYRCGSRQSRNLVELCGHIAQAKLCCKCNLLLQNRMF